MFYLVHDKWQLFRCVCVGLYIHILLLHSYFLCWAVPWDAVEDFPKASFVVRIGYMGSLKFTWYFVNIFAILPFIKVVCDKTYSRDSLCSSHKSQKLNINQFNGQKYPILLSLWYFILLYLWYFGSFHNYIFSRMLNKCYGENR